MVNRHLLYFYSCICYVFVFETHNIFLSQHVLHPWTKTYEESTELNKFFLTTSKETGTTKADRHILHENRLEYGRSSQRSKCVQIIHSDSYDSRALPSWVLKLWICLIHMQKFACYKFIVVSSLHYEQILPHLISISHTHNSLRSPNLHCCWPH
jgi:hypothetical protein